MSETVTLRDGDAIAEVVPARGAIASRFDVGATRVLYMDAATLADPKKNVRGGVPVLFPTPGKLANDAWSYGGKRGTLPQHGFARNEAWDRVGERGFQLSWDARDGVWPWSCAMGIVFKLRGRTLRLDIAVMNASSEPMPFGIGFHPYFFVPAADKPRARVVTGATKAFDNVTKTAVAIDKPIDLAAKEVDLHLLDHGKTECALELPSHAIVVRGSREFTHWVVWTLAGKDFICVEPWTCPGNAVNTGDRVITLAPGESRTAWIEIELRARHGE